VTPPRAPSRSAEALALVHKRDAACVLPSFDVTTKPSLAWAACTTSESPSFVANRADFTQCSRPALRRFPALMRRVARGIEQAATLAMTLSPAACGRRSHRVLSRGSDFSCLMLQGLAAAIGRASRSAKLGDHLVSDDRDPIHDMERLNVMANVARLLDSSSDPGAMSAEIVEALADCIG